MKRLVLSLLFIVCVLASYAREVDPLFGDTIDRTADDFVIASLCVADPTNWRDDYLGTNGHAWIRLQCPIFNLDNSFSYEGEHVNDKLIDYLLGKTKMGMFRYPTKEYIEDYQMWNRAVHEYRLNLPPDVEQRLWEIMDNHVTNQLSLTQDISKYGCASTAAAFVVRALVPKHVHYDVRPEPSTLCCPALLVESWQNATVDGQPLLTYVGDLVEADPVTWWDIWYDTTAGIVIIAILAFIGITVWLILKSRK